MNISFRGDVAKMILLNSEKREAILKGAAKAINDTAKDVRKAAIDEIHGRVKGFSKATVRGYVTVKQAKYKASRVRQDGNLRTNFGGITAKVIVAGKAPNLIYFVPSASRNPDAYRNDPGVTAIVQKRMNIYNNAFIVKAKGNGKMVVVSRSAKAKIDPKGMRTKGPDGKWKWGSKWSKGLYGPPLKALAGNMETFKVMQDTARQVWPGYWRRETERALRDAK